MQNGSWIESKYIKENWRPYLHLARADKQIGTMLLLWPCIWSISLAAPIGTFPDIFTIVKFGIGAIIMRGAGCIINDIWDKDFDRHVDRTKNRPLASGTITVPQALGFLAFKLSLGLGVLVSLNENCILMGFASMPLVVAYPLMKRFLNVPQFVLGLTFNWGALMGWTAVCGSCSLPNVIPLYFGGICWTLVYDTLYGYQDRKDDAKLGLKSAALFLGDKPQIPLTLLSCGMIGCLGAAGYATGLTAPYFVGVGATGAHLLWQVWTADINNSSNLWARFSSNQYTGALVAASIVAGHF